MNNWFDVDKKGLGKLLERRGKGWAIYELIQNAWDTSATEVIVNLEKEGRYVHLSVEDNDPVGFEDLSHAYTLFAPSKKLDDPNKRGRFNLGEKLVLSICVEATISTVAGTISFDRDGERRNSRSSREAGSKFSAIFQLNQDSFDDLIEEIHLLLPPKGITTWINDVELEYVAPMKTIRLSLPTVASNDEGYLINTTRLTDVLVYSADHVLGRDAGIYEMGIPVVVTDDKYITNVQQKIPLSFSRDNVTPSYLRKIRTEVINHMYEDINSEDVANTWIKDGLDTYDVYEDPLRHILKQKYGEKAVIRDPSDPEANDIAASQGYTIVPGNAFSKTTWTNIKYYNILQPAGKVTPSPKPFTEDGRELKRVDNPTEGMLKYAFFLREASVALIGKSVEVVFVNDPGWYFAGAYRNGQIIVNVAKLGFKAFDDIYNERLLDLTIHELAHDIESNHYKEDYHKACTKLGAKLVRFVLDGESNER